MSTTLANPPTESQKSDRTATCVVLQDRIEIPLGINNLDDFREWARSEDFPEQGRIDYIGGRIEVDLMVENVFYHGSSKSEIAAVVLNRVRNDRSGRAYIDRMRISHPTAEVSAEPDMLFLSFDAIKAGRVTFIPAKDDDPDSFVEIEGSPDWVCEIVSDSSEQKDTVRLAERYFSAGVVEYWLVDARGDALTFTVLQRGADAFVAVPADADGYRKSQVFGQRYHFSRERGPDGHWEYRLDEKPLA